MEIPRECCIEPLGSISHGVSNLVKPTGKRLLGRPMSRWEDNIRMDLKEIATNTRNLVGSAQDEDSWRALFLRIPYVM